MKRIAIVLMCLFAVHVHAVDKSRYDLVLPGSLAKSTGHQLQGAGFGSQMLKGEIMQASLITGGFFTIGTHKGLDDDSALDDLCGITFGHPYAMTSFPLVNIDGNWLKPDEATATLSELHPQKAAGRLWIASSLDDLDFEFSLSFSGDERQVILETVIRNNDTSPHQVGGGLVLDPALGKWGDGTLYLDEMAVQQDTVVVTAGPVYVWERPSDNERGGFPAVPGMGFTLQFEPAPGQLFCRNWPDVVQNAGPDGSGPSQWLYDCVLQSFWPVTQLAAGAVRTMTVTLSLQQPRFGNAPFMRWDLPRFLTTETRRLFPRQLTTTVCAGNAASAAYPDLMLEIGDHRLLESNTGASSFSLSRDGWAYVPVRLHTAEIYEERVASVTAVMTNRAGSVLDVLYRNVLIPAVPVSDTGLVVQVDSTFYGDDKINVVFNVEIEETGQKIFDLLPDQVFLYQNEKRIKDFSMEKFSGGGANMADIVFVLDCSGSMGDEIDAVRSNLGEFADSLVAGGYDFRIGVVTFSTTVDRVWDLSHTVEQIKTNLAGVGLWGGTEDSPLALYRASELSFRPGSRRTIIWITDEPYPEHSYTKQQIVERMLALGITVHGVGLTSLQTDWFNPIVLSTGGNFYNITGNFRDILLDVANMESQDRYHIAWPGSESVSNHIRIKVHYAGLGGQVQFYTDPPAAPSPPVRLACFPNPFNPVVKIRADMPADSKSSLSIYNLLGQQIRQFDVTPAVSKEILWDARDEFGRPVGAGAYFVQLVWRNGNGVRKQITRKILYVK